MCHCFLFIHPNHPTSHPSLLISTILYFRSVFLSFLSVLYVSTLVLEIKVCDEEARQWRAWNLLYSCMQVRGLPVADLCHPLWNDFQRGVAAAGLLGALLKCTSVTNYQHGPWKSGQRFLTVKMAAQKICKLAKDDDSFWNKLSESVFSDRGWPADSNAITPNDFLSSKAVCRRLPFVTCCRYENEGAY